MLCFLFIVPDNLLFYTLTGTGQVGFHAVGWPVTPYLTLVGWSSNPSAITYDPIEKVRELIGFYTKQNE